MESSTSLQQQLTQKSLATQTIKIKSTNMVNNTQSSSWSYSHFMYLLHRPFYDDLNDFEKLLITSNEDIELLLKDIRNECIRLAKEMHIKKIKFRQNKMFVHCIDVDYIYPDNYNFIENCLHFIDSAGIIAFHHLNKYDLIKKLRGHFQNKLSMCKHPLTADTIWHLNPFLMDFMRVNIINVYNFRGETPTDRRSLAELMNFPTITKFPVDEHNVWDIDMPTFVDISCEKTIRDPLSLCNFIRKYK